MKLGFNYRDDFHDYAIQHRHDGLTWLVDGHKVHSLKASLTHPMKTSIILRTNKHGAMRDAIMELAWVRFVPEAEL